MAEPTSIRQFLVEVENDVEDPDQLDALLGNYPGDPVADLANGDFVPERPIEVTFALRSLAQGFTCIGDEPWRAVPGVTEPEVEAVSDAYVGDPIGDLALGKWHPSKPVEVAWALSLLAQEAREDGSALEARVRALETLLIAQAAPVMALIGPRPAAATGSESL